VPFIFKRAIDTFTSGSSSAAIGWMLLYGMSRGVYTLLQEPRALMRDAPRCMPSLHLLTHRASPPHGRLHAPPPLAPPQELRYLTFTPVGQNALRRFMADAFAHVQSLDAAWLTQQSTGELSRVFARGVRGMSALLRLLLFNVLPLTRAPTLAQP
jgi:ATP-binding cassette subfamily B protein